jgi:hypothetical protein
VWIGVSKDSVVYTASGKLLCRIHCEGWSNNDWKPKSKIEYEYDDAGRTLVQQQFDWVSGVWKGFYRYEYEYDADGRITNPMEMPTTIGRVVAFAETQCDKTQKQTIQLLAQWLRDDYEQSHPKEIEALAETDPLVMINGDVNGDVIERGGSKNENSIGKGE